MQKSLLSRSFVYLLSLLSALVQALIVIARAALQPFARIVPRTQPSSTPPASPAAELPPARHDRTRREVLTLASVVMGGCASMLIGIPVVGALIAPLLRPQTPVWRSVGNVGDFKVGDTVTVTFEDPSPLDWAGVASQSAAWLRRITDDQFEAFSVNCTHLGCPVRWFQNASIFMCPCHGGVFYADGRVAGGPPQRPLFAYPVRVVDGQVEVLAGPVHVV